MPRPPLSGSSLRPLPGFITTRNAEIEYEEGGFVGYRAFEKKRIAPVYEFGYGLSYTGFVIVPSNG